MATIIKFSFPMVNLVWGNDEVNETPKISHQSTITHHELEKKPNITQAQKPTITHHELAKEPTHEDEKIVLVLALAGGFAIWNVFRMKHEIRQKHAEHENGNCSSQNHAEHENGNCSSQTRAEHEIRQNHAEPKLGKIMLNTKMGTAV